MELPALKQFASEDECKKYYVDNYCNKEIYTYDGIRVKFHEDTFGHAFYTRAEKKWKAKKDHYSVERGERIDWIKCVLEDKNIVPRQGYDKAKRRYDNSRRVTFLAPNNYVVVIMLYGNRSAKFVTAYLVDSDVVAEKIKNSPRWSGR